MSRASIANATGLSQVTVNQIARRLRQAGYVVEERGDEACARSSRRGRRISLLRFNAASGYVLGIDIAPAAVVVLVADLNGKIIAEERRCVGTIGELHPRPLLSLVRTAAQAALATVRVRPSDVRAVGIGVPGRVDPRSGRISLAPALPGWDGLIVGRRPLRRLDCPIVVENDMHLAMLAERGFGSAKAVDNAVYLHLGVGIGLGILIRGELYRGAAGAAGEIAFIPVCSTDETPQGAFGTFEWAAGSTAFERLGRRAAASSPGGLIQALAGGDLSRIDARVVVEAARQGDPDAAAVLDEVAKQLARGICAVQCILDPGTIILGGEVSRAGSLLLERLNEEIQRTTRPPVGKIVVSPLGDEVVALGAVQVALYHVEERFFTVVPKDRFLYGTNRGVSISHTSFGRTPPTGGMR
jgi:predicted NBD/HSP70 family sugar kinase